MLCLTNVIILYYLAFYMKCQRQITKIRWQDHIMNSEVAARTGLGPVSDLITRRRNSVFGHIARLPEDTPAHQAPRCHVDLTLGHLPDQSWKRRPGRPNNRWIDQLRRDNNMPPADLWRRSTTRGHSGVTLRSSMTTRWRRTRPVHAWLSVAQTTHVRVSFYCFFFVFGAFCGHTIHSFYTLQQKWVNGQIGACLLGTRWYDF